MSATATHHRSCHLCEAMCGVELDVEGDRVVAVRGDHEDPFSRGHICPKGVALMDVHHDPDRLRGPMRRRGERWEPIGWDEALRETAARLAAIQSRDGDDAVGLYQGNPTTHNYGVVLLMRELVDALGSRNVYSTASIDHLPHMLVSWEMFGSRALLPIPDVDRTDFMLMLGANPAVSNGSVMTAPGIRRRLADLRERGGRLVVVDPRRTRTAEMADTHLAIRPCTDALLLLALVHVLVEDGLADLGRLAAFTDGLDDLVAAARPFSPERVAAATGIDSDAIRTLAHDFAGARSAVAYGRLGVCQQPFGALCCWLVVALNAITGNLDGEGGFMFTTPAVDTAVLARLFGDAGSFDRWRSRVGGLPEFGGELPVSTLAEEILTPGSGRLRALVLIAGNPVLTTPAGSRLDEALRSLEFTVAIDTHLNETTRHADIVLPPPSGLERDHYPLLHASLGVRNVARYSTPVFEPPPGALQEWQIVAGLARRIAARKGPSSWPVALRAAGAGALGPRRLLSLTLLLGPHGPRPRRRGVTLRRLERRRRTVDLGPLEAGRLPRRLQTRGRRLRLAPPRFVADVRRAEALLAEHDTNADGLVLIGRRQLRDNNSWMHNSERLMKGPARCTLLINPSDAGRRGVTDGSEVRVRSRAGAVVVTAQVSDEMREGVVSLPHGYGHSRAGTRHAVAVAHAGVSANDVTDPLLRDELSGTAAVNGVPVELELVGPAVAGSRPTEIE